MRPAWRPNGQVRRRSPKHRCGGGERRCLSRPRKGGGPQPCLAALRPHHHHSSTFAATLSGLLLQPLQMASEPGVGHRNVDLIRAACPRSCRRRPAGMRTAVDQRRRTPAMGRYRSEPAAPSCSGTPSPQCDRHEAAKLGSERAQEFHARPDPSRTRVVCSRSQAPNGVSALRASILRAQPLEQGHVRADPYRLSPAWFHNVLHFDIIESF